MASFFKSLFGSAEPKPASNTHVRLSGAEARYHVSADSSGITCTDPNGATTRARWEQISGVTMLAGFFVVSVGDPFNKDYTINQESFNMMVPIGATGQDDLVGAMLNMLPDFDRAALVNALGNLDERSVLWKKKSG